MMYIGISDVKKTLKLKQYTELTKNGIPNIVGIRNSIADGIDYIDRCWVWWTENGVETIHTYTITTVPGQWYLFHPIDPDIGCAILVPNQYRDCWHLGTMHDNGQYALVEIGDIKVYRDNIKDGKLHYDPATISKPDNYAIDLHHGSLQDGPLINGNSAGCLLYLYAGNLRGLPAHIGAACGCPVGS